jgi:hypothetical protein
MPKDDDDSAGSHVRSSRGADTGGIMLALEIVRGPEAGRRLEACPGDVIGSRTGGSAAYGVRGAGLSNPHFAIVCGELHGRVRDLNTTNGTVVSARVSDAPEERRPYRRPHMYVHRESA